MRIYRYGHSRLPAKTKRILGHELAGEVAKVGSKVKGITEGMRVAVSPNYGCGMCNMCQRGWFHLCADYGAIGLTVDGGMSEYVRIPKGGKPMPYVGLYMDSFGVLHEDSGQGIRIVASLEPEEALLGPDQEYFVFFFVVMDGRSVLLLYKHPFAAIY